MKHFAFFVLLLTSLIGSAQQGLLWKVTSPKGKTSYLLGTFHLVNSGYLQQSPKVLEYFNQSQTLVLELVHLEGAESAMLKFSFSRDSSLQQVLAEEDYQFVMQRLEEYLGQQAAALNMFKPLVATLMVSAAISEEETPDSLRFEGNPVEWELERLAKERQMKCVGLETAEEQAQLLFSDQTEGQQARELLAMLRDERELREETRNLIQCYFQDNLDCLLEISKEAEARYGSMDKLLKNRNLRWLPTLLKEMKKSSCFIAVGALHLSGPYGLLELLKKEGYTLESIPLK